ncbi:4-alpha-glucanotransferase [candidate division KSB1 bacterium]|nr:4-alpha-glucanotransferase [candidate division KSB1 bacterium]
MIIKRGNGILLHLTSLPSEYGIGDMGPGAYEFIDFLEETKQSYWQMLPLNPTNPAMDNSPYSSVSMYAGNPLVISPALLLENDLLTKSDLKAAPEFPAERVSYDDVIKFKNSLFYKAFERFNKNKKLFISDFEHFIDKNEHWIEDFAFFRALKSSFKEQSWGYWQQEVRDRKESVLEPLKKKLRDRIELEKFIQFMFYDQWRALKKYCNDKGVQIIGDVPYYVSYDSVEVWKNPEIFKLDKKKMPEFVAGVPPDYFSDTGQLWGNPVFRWDVLKETEYDWWIQRMKHNLSLFDIVRIDHFRGFVAFWEVPASEKTAIHGEWVKAPVMDYFNTVLKHFPHLPIIAEDLGFITPDVVETIHHFGFPGMRVLSFAFDENLPRNPDAPHNHIQNCIVYTGTHDNNTVKGWFKQEANDKMKKSLFTYAGRTLKIDEVPTEFVRMAMKSVANTCIIPMQDLLGLGHETRMNRPATSSGNWSWRLLPNKINRSLKKRLTELTEIYGRV